ncbi:DNA repair protein RadA [uncultured Jatrophihabitans sp.]|uniref:DNA repair protein RadA n=1 Tax=uncultured Jatrophihabitans sp. TaxID=1610747 RepID=UPI0035CB9E90
MPRPSTAYRCSSCGATAGKWYGRCPKCGEFSTLAEYTAPSTREPGLRSSTKGSTPNRPARRVSEVVTGGPAVRLSTGIGEFDRVLGGGMVPGQVCLCSGPPGSGKSTLLLAVADRVARAEDRPVLYVSGEESVEQIALRAQRIGATSANLLLADDVDLGSVIGHLDEHAGALALVVIDSVQTIASADVDGRAGGVTQTMEVAQALSRVAKARGLPMLLVGQVTKDSTVAGPRALEHIVDTTLSLDGDKHTSLRLLRTVKNRFGALEVAAFEQRDDGMHEVLDPSSLFREHRTAPVAGTCPTVTMEGARAIVAELQALVGSATVPNGRRAVSGLDTGRAAMLIAVTERAGGEMLWNRDVYIATAAGMRVSDPGTDLAVCLAVMSAHGAASTQEKVVPLDTLVIGEVTLSGDVRPVPMMTERAAEAVRLGYRRLLVPVGTRGKLGRQLASARFVEVGTLREAMLALQAPPAPSIATARGVTLRPVPNE